tara:strand:+ start:862 stop:1296 length:435 start_codon:yes stop_codon:yes gene_type:complete
MLDKMFFIKIGPNVRDRYRDHIFEDAKDVFGKPFKAYSKSYGERKRANKFKLQASDYANSKAPVLTQQLLNDYSLIKTMRNGFQIGWATLGARVEALKKLGRVLTTPQQPLPEKVISYLSKEAHGYIKKKLGPNKTTTYKIGRK